MNPSVKCRSFPGRKAYDILSAYMNTAFWFCEHSNTFSAQSPESSSVDSFMYASRAGFRAKGTRC